MFQLASKYYSVFQGEKAGLLLLLIEQYVNAAEIQVKRVERARRVIHEFLAKLQANPTSYTRDNRRETLWGDAHFYFICLGQVNRLLARLCSELKNRDLQQVHSQFKKELKPEFRNDLEHLEDRVFGLKRSGRKKRYIGNIQDFINFTGGGVSFNGTVYPVNSKSLKMLIGFYKEIISVIRKDYALKNRWFMLHEWQERRSKAIQRMVRHQQKHFLKGT